MLIITCMFSYLTTTLKILTDKTKEYDINCICRIILCIWLDLSDIGACDKKDQTKHTNIIETKNKANNKTKQNKNTPVHSVSLFPT